MAFIQALEVIDNLIQTCQDADIDNVQTSCPLCETSLTKQLVSKLLLAQPYRCNVLNSQNHSHLRLPKVEEE